MSDQFDWQEKEGRPRRGQRIIIELRGSLPALIGMVVSVSYAEIGLSDGITSMNHPVHWPFKWRLDHSKPDEPLRPQDHPLWSSFKAWADAKLNPNIMLNLYWDCWLSSAAATAKDK